MKYHRLYRCGATAPTPTHSPGAVASNPSGPSPPPSTLTSCGRRSIQCSPTDPIDDVTRDDIRKHVLQWDTDNRHVLERCIVNTKPHWAAALATTHPYAKVEPVIPPGRPCHTSLVIVPDIDLYSLLTVANIFPWTNT